MSKVTRQPVVAGDPAPGADGGPGAGAAGGAGGRAGGGAEGRGADGGADGGDDGGADEGASGGGADGGGADGGGADESGVGTGAVGGAGGTGPRPSPGVSGCGSGRDSGRGSDGSASVRARGRWRRTRRSRRGRLGSRRRHRHRGRRGHRRRRGGCGRGRHQPHRGEVDDLPGTVLLEHLGRRDRPDVHDHRAGDLVVPAAPEAAAIHHRGPGQAGHPEGERRERGDAEHQRAHERPTEADRAAGGLVDHAQARGRLAGREPRQTEQRRVGQTEHEHHGHDHTDPGGRATGREERAVGEVGGDGVQPPHQQPVEDEGVEATVETRGRVAGPGTGGGLRHQRWVAWFGSSGAGVGVGVAMAVALGVVVVVGVGVVRVGSPGS